MDSRDTSRRRLLGNVAAAAGVTAAPAIWTSGRAQEALPSDPFRLGVASGEPTPTGFVLWARLCPDPARADGGMQDYEEYPVDWQIALLADQRFEAPVASGRVYSRRTYAHSVHLECEGLKPGTEYRYRFRVAPNYEAEGETRTAPAPDSDVAELRMAVASCQKYEVGYYHAYRAIAAAKPHLVLFLGDYIYESECDNDRAVRGRRHTLPVADTLDRYRRRYSLYKSDDQLRAAHAAAPWLVIWDDHEVANNYPNPAVSAARRRAAYQAFWEHMPLSHAFLTDQHLYRSRTWGKLAQIELLDTRQYRTAPCVTSDPARHTPKLCNEPGPPPTPTIWASEQRAWFKARVAESRATWNILAQPTLIGRRWRRGEERPFSTDGWDGYAASREAILSDWSRTAATKIAFGGDLHAFFHGVVRRSSGQAIANEFVCGSVTSHANISRQEMTNLISDNENLRWGDRGWRGYCDVKITPAACEVKFQGVHALEEGNLRVELVKEITVPVGWTVADAPPQPSLPSPRKPGPRKK